MARRKRSIGLLTFLRGERDPKRVMPGCANYDHHYGGCLFCWKGCDPEDCLYCVDFAAIREYSRCLVEQEQRCGYFERAVLPTAESIGLKKFVYSLYRRHVGIEDDYLLDAGEIRRCPDCEAELKPRQRYCDSCSAKRRLESYRKSKRKAG